MYADVQAALGELRAGEIRNLVPSVHADDSLEDARGILRDASAESAIVLEGDDTVGVIRKSTVLEIPLATRMQEKVRDHMLRVHALTSEEPMRAKPPGITTQPSGVRAR